MSTHPVTNFAIQRYHQNEPQFNGVYSRNWLPKINDGAKLIHSNEYKLIWIHWIALYANSSDATYFDSFGVEDNQK